MKVLIINSWIRMGGAESLCLELADFLVKNGHEVGILSAFVDFSYAEKNTLNKIQFITPWKFLGELSKKHLSLFAVLGCPAILFLALKNGKRFDIYNAHNFPGLWVSVITGIVFGKKIVWHFNEKQPLPQKIEFLDKIFIKRVNEITVLDEKNVLEVGQLFKRNALLIRAGIDYALWSKKEKSPDYLMKQYNLSGKTILLSVGKIHPQKNQGSLIDALSLLKDKIPNIILVLVGVPIYKKKLREKAKRLNISERVVFTGIVSGETLRSLYNQAFLLCFPAFDQTWGLTPFEALCQDTASIVSSQAGVAETLGKEKIGFVAEPTAQAFADKILFALENKPMVLEMVKRGKEYVRHNFTWDFFGKTYLEIFRKTLQEE